MARAAFVGLGNIGTPIARRLLANPDGLLVHDIRPEAVDALVRRGAVAAGGIEGVADAEVISIMVRDDAQVRSVVGEILPVCRPGTVLAVHSTIAPETAEALAADAEEAGAAVLDAPVTGGVAGASTGRLALLVGGDPAALRRASPVFELWASYVHHFGPAGAGTRAKLARNLLQFVALAAAGEAQRLAAAAGIDLVALGEVVRHSDAVTGGPGAILLRDTAAPPQPGDGWFEAIAGATQLGEKDLALALELGEHLGVDLPLATAAYGHLAAAWGVPSTRSEP